MPALQTYYLFAYMEARFTFSSLSNFLLCEVGGIVILREVVWLIWDHKQMKDRRGILTQVYLSNPLHSAMQPARGHVKPLQGLTSAGYCSLSWVREFTTYLFYICIRKAFSYTNLISAKIHSSRRLNRSAPLIRTHEYWYYYDFYLIKVACGITYLAYGRPAGFLGQISAQYACSTQLTRLEPQSKSSGESLWLCSSAWFPNTAPPPTSHVTSLHSPTHTQSLQHWLTGCCA